MAPPDVAARCYPTNSTFHYGSEQLDVVTRCYPTNSTFHYGSKQLVVAVHCCLTHSTSHYGSKQLNVIARCHVTRPKLPFTMVKNSLMLKYLITHFAQMSKQMSKESSAKQTNE